MTNHPLKKSYIQKTMKPEKKKERKERKYVFFSECGKSHPAYVERFCIANERDPTNGGNTYILKL